MSFLPGNSVRAGYWTSSKTVFCFNPHLLLQQLLTKLRANWPAHRLSISFHVSISLHLYCYVTQFYTHHSGIRLLPGHGIPHFLDSLPTSLPFFLTWLLLSCLLLLTSENCCAPGWQPGPCLNLPELPRWFLPLQRHRVHLPNNRFRMWASNLDLSVHLPRVSHFLLALCLCEWHLHLP